jgi:hypothetical protein
MSLTALSPLDGRYRADVAELEAYFSEAALFRYRVRVEVEYLIFLTRARNIDFVPKLDPRALRRCATCTARSPPPTRKRLLYGIAGSTTMSRQSNTGCVNVSMHSVLAPGRKRCISP